ncbi:MAG: hypothetical protein ACYTHK_19945 [Planctomycetota bacterium]|jgi:hypothetical protein
MDPEVAFFILMAIIAAIAKIREMSKQVRKKSIRKQVERAGKERLDLVRVGMEVVEAPPEPAKPKPLPLRPLRETRVRPSRRTRRAVAAAAPAVVEHAPKLDTSFVARLRNNPEALKEAIVLREVLGPPVAMRGYRFPRR